MIYLLQEHPDDKDQAGSAILIKSNLKYESLQNITEHYVQACGIKIDCNNFSLPIYAIYCRPSYRLFLQNYEKKILKSWWRLQC